MFAPTESVHPKFSTLDTDYFSISYLPIFDKFQQQFFISLSVRNGECVIVVWCLFVILPKLAKKKNAPGNKRKCSELKLNQIYKSKKYDVLRMFYVIV